MNLSEWARGLSDADFWAAFDVIEYEAARRASRERGQDLEQALAGEGIWSPGGQVFHTRADCHYLALGDDGNNINRGPAPPGLRKCSRCATLDGGGRRKLGELS